MAEDFDLMEDSNRSANPSIHDISDPARRVVLRGGLGALTVGALAPWLLARAASAGGGSRARRYLTSYKDASGAYLDGGQDYRLRLPAGIPAKNFWSVTVYNTETRSLLQNGQPKPSISSAFDQPEVNPDGSVDIYFGPAAREGKEKNWVKTVPGHGWFTYIRLYGPLEPFFEQTWRPDDIVKA